MYCSTKGGIMDIYVLIHNVLLVHKLCINSTLCIIAHIMYKLILCAYNTKMSESTYFVLVRICL